MTVKQNKKEIRTLITNKKKAMSVEEITAGSRIITDRLELSKEYQDNDNILIYVSYNQEVETSGIINKSLERGKKVYVPKVIINKEDRSDKYMEFVRINSYDDLQDIWELKNLYLTTMKFHRTDFLLCRGLLLMLRLTE